MFNFKHKKTGKIVHPDCMNKIPQHLTNSTYFEPVREPVTHQMSEYEGPEPDDDNLGGLLVGIAVAEAIMDDSSAMDNTPVEADFGGGDGGGAGATDSY